ncbi:hypothetical protein BVY01_04465 [bacterium I07]|nr:hypothetical protein BVY01_04465 [bacterium I07]
MSEIKMIDKGKKRNNTSDRTNMINKVISHYNILSKLGEGGMGEVYLAEDTKLDRKVALKFLPSHMTKDKSAVERFKREAKAAAALNHPNIVTIYEIGEYGGQIYIAMEHVDGHSLREEIEKGPIEVEQVVDITKQICEGLDKAHKADIIHRDIKPENILIDNDGRVRILDFGLARMKGVSKLTKESSTLGTVKYMSPEQLRGEEVGQRTDIWSLGVVMYELLTGEVPFKGDYEQAVVYGILNEESSQLLSSTEKIPDLLKPIIRHTIEKNIEKRYQAVNEILESIEKTNESFRLGEITSTSIKSSKIKRPAFLIPILLVLFTVLFFLQKYWRAKQIKGSEVNSVPTLAIVYFENETRDDKNQMVANALRSMLIQTLRQASGLKITPHQILYEKLDEIGEKSINRINASEIALKAMADMMLVGSLYSINNQFQVNFEIYSLNPIQLVYTNTTNGENEISICTEMKKLVLTQFDITHSIPKVKLTTKNNDARRYFYQGYDFTGLAEFDKARQNFDTAIQLDSAFAIAYLYRGLVIRGLPEEKRYFVEKANEYIDNVSQYEQLIINGELAMINGEINTFLSDMKELLLNYPNDPYAYMKLTEYHGDRREYQESINYAKKWISIGSYQDAYSWIIPQYVWLGKQDSARIYVNKLIEFRPNDAPTFLVLGEYYLMIGDFREAIQEAERARQIGSINHWANHLLGRIYFFSSRYDSAESAFRSIEDSDYPEFAVKNISILKCYQGKYVEMLGLLDNWKKSNDVSIQRMAYKSERIFHDLVGNKTRANFIWNTKERDIYSILIESLTGRLKKGFELLWLRIPDAYYNHNYSTAINLCQRAYDEIRDNNIGTAALKRLLLWHSHILFELKKYEDAGRIYQKLSENEFKTFWQYRLALCYYFQERFQEMRKILMKHFLLHDKLGEGIDPYSYAYNEMQFTGIEFGYAYSRTLYLLGVANEKLGFTEEAIPAYEKFLDIWKDADEDLPELIDAKNRLAALKGNP